jgi:23S rRNA (guanosine2251-2'-O)-methyltransferase
MEQNLMSDFIIGRNAVVEALRSKVDAKELIVAAKVEIDQRVHEALTFARKGNLPIKEYPRTKVDELVGSKDNQGIALRIESFKYAQFDNMINAKREKPILLGLDGITDQHNLGAIIRSAAAFGVNGVVIPERRSAEVSGSVWKSSAGTAAKIDIAQVVNMVRSIESAKKKGFFVVGLDMDGQESLPKFSLFDEPLFLIVGSEGKGISRLVKEKCDLILSIPMNGITESLNASVATAITLYSIFERRNASAN